MSEERPRLPEDFDLARVLMAREAEGEDPPDTLVDLREEVGTGPRIPVFEELRQLVARLEEGTLEPAAFSTAALQIQRRFEGAAARIDNAPLPQEEAAVLLLDVTAGALSGFAECVEAMREAAARSSLEGVREALEEAAAQAATLYEIYQMTLPA
jgi:hypothetical protein